MSKKQTYQDVFIERKENVDGGRWTVDDGRWTMDDVVLSHRLKKGL
jgi:hypothetical protein